MTCHKVPKKQDINSCDQLVINIFLTFYDIICYCFFDVGLFFWLQKLFIGNGIYFTECSIYERHIHPSVSRKVWLMQIVAKGPISGLPSNQTVHSLINTHQKKIEKKVYDVRNVNLLSSVCPDRILATCLELRTGRVDSRWYLVFAQVFRLIIGTQSHVS